VEESALFGANVDEGGLDAGEHCVDPAQVDITDHSSGVWTVDEQLNELVVLQNRDPRFARSRVDEDFSFHCSPLPLTVGDSAAGAKAVPKKSARSCYRAAL
jgi:hypothetical protein